MCGGEGGGCGEGERERAGGRILFRCSIGVGRFRILGGPRGGQIPSRHMTS